MMRLLSRGLGAHAKRRISPQAIVHPRARLGRGTSVGPFSIIGPDVTIGEACEIGPHVVIKGPCRIGDRNRIFQFASVGESPPDKKYQDEATWLIIGDGNTIREGVTLHRGTVQDQGQTLVGNHNLLLAYMHVAHDCVIGNHVVLSNNVLLAGHVTVEDHAIIGGGTAVSQRVCIGTHSFVGGHIGIPGKDVPPFVKVVTGPKPTPCGINVVGLQRAGFDNETISALRDTYKMLYKQNNTAAEAIALAKAKYPNHPQIKQLADFVAQSGLGILR